jgi:spore coat polysaccharide biosynthesis protein SpsF (cytidylyltransferase family)
MVSGKMLCCWAKSIPVLKSYSMKIVAIVQARMCSTRLSGKVMKTIGGVPMIELLLARLAMAKHVDQIVLSTSKYE